MQVTCQSIINGPLRHAAQIIRARLPHALRVYLFACYITSLIIHLMQIARKWTHKSS